MSLSPLSLPLLLVLVLLLVVAVVVAAAVSVVDSIGVARGCCYFGCWSFGHAYGVVSPSKLWLRM